MTGRKIIVDTYGGYARHGGGAFSGKDASKVDRSAAYMARYIAKNIVATGWADKCEVQLSYAIGLAEPMSVRIDTFGTATIPEHRIYQAVMNQADCRPTAIIRRFHLTSPCFSKVSCYGHFGILREAAFGLLLLFCLPQLEKERRNEQPFGCFDRYKQRLFR